MRRTRIPPFPALLLAVVFASDAAGSQAAVTVAPPGRTFEGDCTAFLRALADGKVTTTPCNVPVNVRPGDYEAWVESATRISPATTVLHVSAKPLRAELPWSEAGSIAVSAPPASAAVRLYALDALFWREGSERPVPFPPGRSVAIAFDKDGHAIALSSIIEVAAGAAVTRKLEPPSAADLLVIVEKESAGEIRMTLTGERRAEPDALFATARSWMALWYGRAARSAELQVLTATSHVPRTEIRLRPRGVTVFETRLRPLPSIDVTVLLEGKVPATQEIAFTVKPVGLPEPVLTAAGAPSMTTRFERLVPRSYRVTAEIGAFEFSRTVDLTAGDDANVLFSLEPVVLTGNVTLGGEEARAVLRFVLGKKLEVETDEHGRFEILLWQKGRYGLQVTLPDHPGQPPFHDLIRVPGDTHLDLDIPKNAFRLLVRDSSTRKPIAGVKVDGRNRFESADEERGTAIRVETGEDGEAALPPIRPGTLEIYASAAGYAKSELTRPVGKGDLKETIEIALTPLGSENSVAVLLPDGSPAAGAAVTIVDRHGRFTFTGETGRDGLAILPPDLGGTLVVKHPQAGTEVREHAPGRTPPPIRMRPLAPPLRISFVDEAGQPVPSAEVLVVVDGLRLSGNALAAWSGFSSATSTRGIWFAFTPPAAPIRIVAARSATIATIAAGAYDQQAQDVAFPWGPELILKAAQ
ncbi:MAG TPA: hypothetical protein VEO54_15505 [Thermoanaerobaculia bacterium]|nr:hypothetical protein [Thermoanaerobaculia bacterium]